MDSPNPSRAASRNHVEAILKGNMSILIELWDFLKTRKNFWLLPVIAVMLLFGVMLVFAQGSALAPFIYTLF